MVAFCTYFIRSTTAKIIMLIVKSLQALGKRLEHLELLIIIVLFLDNFLLPACLVQSLLERSNLISKLIFFIAAVSTRLHCSWSDRLSIKGSFLRFHHCDFKLWSNGLWCSSLFRNASSLFFIDRRRVLLTLLHLFDPCRHFLLGNIYSGRIIFIEEMVGLFVSGCMILDNLFRAIVAVHTIDFIDRLIDRLSWYLSLGFTTLGVVNAQFQLLNGNHIMKSRVWTLLRRV